MKSHRVYLALLKIAIGPILAVALALLFVLAVFIFRYGSLSLTVMSSDVTVILDGH